jgi:Tol biopolymer transport system component
MLWEVAHARGTRVLPGDPDGVVNATLPSPDARRIAYGVRRADSRFELRSIGADGQWVTTLIPTQQVYEPMPLDWSADGRDVLCALRYPDGSTDIVLVAADGSGLRHVQRFGERGLVHARLSPDGRYVVSSIRRGRGSLGPVSIAPTDGSGSRPLLDGSDFGGPVWTPDGHHVLVLKLADPQRFTLSAWLVPVEEGTPGKPELTTIENLSFPIDQWMTSEGLLYQSVTSRWADIYAAPIDLWGKTPPGRPVQIVERDPAQQGGPAWSPDGRFLAYLVQSQFDDERAFPTERLLMIKNLSDGTTRQVPVSLDFIGGYVPAWTPDGQALALWGRDGLQDANFGHFRIDLSSGEATLLARIGMLAAPTYSQFSADGTRFLYLHPKRGVVDMDLRSQVDSVLLPHTRESSVGTFSLSPDGRKLAYAATRGTGESRVRSVRVRAGDTDHELARFGREERGVVHGWTPDGTGVIYGHVKGERQQLYRIAASGGEPVDLQFTGPVTPNPYRLSPDGTRIVYLERLVDFSLRILPVRFRAGRHLPIVPH